MREAEIADLRSDIDSVSAIVKTRDAEHSDLGRFHHSSIVSQISDPLSTVFPANTSRYHQDGSCTVHRREAIERIAERSQAFGRSPWCLRWVDREIGFGHWVRGTLHGLSSAPLPKRSLFEC